MEKYIKIKNAEEIGVNAFCLIGACTKRDDNSKIGFFGSGLKYALAVLLRNNISFDVYSGTKKFDFTVETEMFRDKPFNVIYVNGQKTSFTTDMGPEWKIWQAIREIYCNALDEKMPLLSQVDDIVPVAGETAFYIQTKQIEEIITNWEKYFAIGRVAIVENNEYKVYRRYSEKVTLYRRGIRCSDMNKNSLYDYNFRDIRINESRVVAYNWETNELLAKLWSKIATPYMIKQYFKLYTSAHADCRDNSVEHSISWSYHGVFNDNWLNAVKGFLLIPFESAGFYKTQINTRKTIILPKSLIMFLKAQFQDDVESATVDFHSNHIVVKPSEKQTFLLQECMKFFEEVQMTIPYEIQVVIFPDTKNLMGRIIDDKILLSTNVFDKGKKEIVETIIEEWAHLESGKADETRGFEQYLINQLVNMLENKHGVFL